MPESHQLTAVVHHLAVASPSTLPVNTDQIHIWMCSNDSHPTLNLEQQVRKVKTLKFNPFGFLA